MDFALALDIPKISISLAPEEAILEEPPSPFVVATPHQYAEEEDGLRATHLTPPPTTSPRFHRQQSPLGLSSGNKPSGQGLERERFEALLKSSRERNAVALKKPQQDLRKEVAIKVHKSKQVERRALFLSKFAAPPSPSATSLPKTPPESPAIFHYTLPSPGLVSPLALFESLADENPADPSSKSQAGRKAWVEQVDFRVLKKRQTSGLDATSTNRTNGHHLPSLDEISARLNAQREAAVASASIPTITIESESDREEQQRQSERPASRRLPAFLLQRSERPKAPVADVTANAVNAPVSGPRKVGRLTLPGIRAPQPVKAMPASPLSPVSPQLQVTTLVVSRTSTTSPTELSESNLNALNSRERRSADMLSRLRRRTTFTGAGGVPAQDLERLRLMGLADDLGLTNAHGDVHRAAVAMPPAGMGRASKWKRHSAPAEIPTLDRNDFSHPVLRLPGGF